MRRLRLAAPAQLELVVGVVDATSAWPTMSEQARVEVLSIFARLIARSVVQEEPETEVDG